MAVWDSLRPSAHLEARRWDKRCSIGRSCLYMLLLCLGVSVPASLLQLGRVLPAVIAVDWPSVAERTVRIFPQGLELVFNESRFELRPLSEPATAATDLGGPDPHKYICWEKSAVSWCAAAPDLEPLRLELSPLVWDFFYTDLPSPLPLSPAKLLSFFSLLSSLVTEEPSWWSDSLLDGADAFPNLHQFEPGERVDVLHGPRRLLWAGGWVSGVVVSVHPARDMRSYSYLVRLDPPSNGTASAEAAEEEAAEGGGQRLLLRKRADELRRPPTFVLAHDDIFLEQLPPAKREQLEERRIQLEERRAARAAAAAAAEEARIAALEERVRTVEEARLRSAQAQAAVHAAARATVQAASGTEEEQEAASAAQVAAEAELAEASAAMEAAAKQLRGGLMLGAVPQPASAAEEAGGEGASARAKAPEATEEEGGASLGATEEEQQGGEEGEDEEDEEDEEDDDPYPGVPTQPQLLGLHAAALLTPSELHVLQGFSFSYSQYWQYKSSSRLSLRTTRQPMSTASLRS